MVTGVGQGVRAVVLDFEFQIWHLFRISSFGFRISLHVVHLPIGQSSCGSHAFFAKKQPQRVHRFCLRYGHESHWLTRSRCDCSSTRLNPEAANFAMEPTKEAAMPSMVGDARTEPETRVAPVSGESGELFGSCIASRCSVADGGLIHELPIFSTPDASGSVARASRVTATFFLPSYGAVSHLGGELTTLLWIRRIVESSASASSSANFSPDVL